jgi:uncharacterized Zn-finger protein
MTDFQTLLICMFGTGAGCMILICLVSILGPRKPPSSRPKPSKSNPKVFVRTIPVSREFLNAVKEGDIICPNCGKVFLDTRLHQ